MLAELTNSIARVGLTAELMCFLCNSGLVWKGLRALDRHKTVGIRLSDCAASRKRPRALRFSELDGRSRRSQITSLNRRFPHEAVAPAERCERSRLTMGERRKMNNLQDGAHYREIANQLRAIARECIFQNVRKDLID